MVGEDRRWEGRGGSEVREGRGGEVMRVKGRGGKGVDVRRA